jgi:hypothetical protein
MRKLFHKLDHTITSGLPTTRPDSGIIRRGVPVNPKFELPGKEAPVHCNQSVISYLDRQCHLSVDGLETLLQT